MKVINTIKNKKTTVNNVVVAKSASEFFLSFLKENNALVNFINNVPNPFTLGTKDITLFNAISGLFSWNKTPEGVLYWSELDAKWKEHCNPVRTRLLSSTAAITVEQLHEIVETIEIHSISMEEIEYWLDWHGAKVKYFTTLASRRSIFAFLHSTAMDNPTMLISGAFTWDDSNFWKSINDTWVSYCKRNHIVKIEF